MDHTLELDTCSREELQRSDPTNQVRVYHPSLNPASKEMMSDSVETVRN